jgi:DNA-binding winged helix-turn-helix (wHTH) protein
MESRSRSSRTVQFGTFLADLESGELFNNGARIRLPEQPFRLLTILLERPGEVIGRDELRRRLWPEDTHVDFDRSLNTAACKLRDALGESGDNSCYLETLPQRGYRLIAPVSGAVTVPSDAPENGTRQVTIGRSSFRRSMWATTIAATFMLGLAYWRWHAASTIPVITGSHRLTNDDFSKSPELATDGPRIYFSAWKGGRGSGSGFRHGR